MQNDKKENYTLILLDKILILIIFILIVMSFLALISIHWNLALSYTLTISPSGINTYLNKLGQYKALFTATVASASAYFGLLRLQAATDANIDKLKQDRFSDWKLAIDIRFSETDKKDPYMKREFIKRRYEMFQYLYAKKFTLNNKTELAELIDCFLKDLIPFFESQNNQYIGMGGIYQNEKYAYSLDSFQFLLNGCIAKSYSDMYQDLTIIYLDKLPKDRIIDTAMHAVAQKNYRPIV